MIAVITLYIFYTAKISTEDIKSVFIFAQTEDFCAENRTGKLANRKINVGFSVLSLTFQALSCT